jgi:ABC-type iron transport system FetAB ATPase subunit
MRYGTRRLSNEITDKPTNVMMKWINSTQLMMKWITAQTDDELDHCTPDVELNHSIHLMMHWINSRHLMMLWINSTDDRMNRITAHTRR